VKALHVGGATREANEPGMSANVAMRLRALALDHKEGRLSREAYRKLRAPLIDALVSSVDPQSSTIPNLEPRIRGVGAVPASPQTQTQTETEVAAATGRTRRGRWARVLAWAVAVLRR
jgi:hypothetical protein